MNGTFMTTWNKPEEVEEVEYIPKTMFIPSEGKKRHSRLSSIDKRRKTS